MPLNKSRLAYRRANDRKVKRRANQLEGSVQRWLIGFAVKAADEAIKEMKTGRLALRKQDFTEEELLQILSSFGVRQVEETGSQVTTSLGGTWVVPPRMVADVIATKAIRVKGIVADTKKGVVESIRQIMSDANKERPQPTTAEIARRIRLTFHGLGSGKPAGFKEVGEPKFGILPTQQHHLKYGGDLFTFSPERAALISRTESAQNESQAIATGMEIAGVTEIEWISSGNPVHGDRDHGAMNGKRVKFMVDKFRNPATGNSLWYPGDPTAKIKDTANCGCTYAPVRIEPKAKRAA